MSGNHQRPNITSQNIGILYYTSVKKLHNSHLKCLPVSCHKISSTTQPIRCSLQTTTLCSHLAQRIINTEIDKARKWLNFQTVLYTVTCFVYSNMFCVPQHVLCTATCFVYCNMFCVPQHVLCTATRFVYCNMFCVPQQVLCTATCFVYRNMFCVPYLDPGVDSAPIENEYQKHSWG